MTARLRFSTGAARDHHVLMIDEALATGDRSFRKRSDPSGSGPRRGSGNCVGVPGPFSW